MLVKNWIKRVNIFNCYLKIARKASTFSSVGIPSFFCDPAQALHGDMGQIEKKDVLIILSYSGNTSELSNMLKYANRLRIKIIINPQLFLNCIPNIFLFPFKIFKLFL